MTYLVVDFMEFLSIFLIALGLAADCLAVALSGSISMRTLSFPQVFRASLSFGVFQGLMPVLGWLAGRTIVDLVADYDHWVVFLLLALVGGRMIWESFRFRDGRNENNDITRGWLLLTLSVATSIDALAVGLSFAFIRIKIVVASLTIAGVAFMATAIGFLLGRKVGGLVGKRAEAIGGIVLIAIGLKILLEHIL
jgi:putative Mn2+ efflux pump MntP